MSSSLTPSSCEKLYLIAIADKSTYSNLVKEKSSYHPVLIETIANLDFFAPEANFRKHKAFQTKFLHCPNTRLPLLVSHRRLVQSILATVFTQAILGEIAAAIINHGTHV